MGPLETAEIGTTGLRVTRLGLGCAALGGLYADVAEEAAVSTVQRGLQLGVSYIDTAPYYGHGKSESFVGQGLVGVSRDTFVLSTKVGRLLKPVESMPESEVWANLPPYDFDYDYSREGVMRSLEGSLRRLKLDRVDIMLNHVPDEYLEQSKEAYPVLMELRSQGVVRAVGVGMDSWEGPAQIAREYDIDCILLAGRYTLLDHSGLAKLLPLCEQKSISVILGGPYNSGILASDLSPGAKFFYGDAPPEMLERARRIKSVCDRYEVPLKAAALQFGLGHPAVAATIPGARSAAEVQENFDIAGYPIPSDLWAALRQEGMVPEAAPTPSEA